MSLRRATNPQVVQAVWESIKTFIHQKNLPTHERVIRHLRRVLNISETEAEEELRKTLQDGLITSRQVLLKSGNGVYKTSYKCPSKNDVQSISSKDSHDWYCYECHKAGEVELCQNCHRVFHTKCYETESLNQISRICGFCEKIINDVYNENNDLMVILKFMIGHLKAKLPPAICDRVIIAKQKLNFLKVDNFIDKTYYCENEDTWRPTYLIKNHVDLTMMEFKIEFNMYKNLSEFQADIHNILHNIIVYHGEDSAMATVAKRTYEECCYDISEIRRCSDCYRISNEKSDKKNWYCEPCNPPHELVYAKQKGYPYWPAKVMQVKDNMYDVRFFGGYHSRAFVEKSYIKPITTDLKVLQIKRNITWQKAYDELKIHQKLLEDVKENGYNKYQNILSESPESSPKGIKDVRIAVERIKTGSPASVESKSENQPNNNTHTNNNVPCDYNISVEEEEEEEIVIDDVNKQSQKSSDDNSVKEESQEDMVTSSCQETRNVNVYVQTDSAVVNGTPLKQQKKDKQAEKNLQAALDKLRREMEQEKCNELQSLQEDHARELRQLIEKHQRVISELKKKQWCYNCEAEAIYHCCWNTAYCSTDCQQIHWQREHKRVCRRKK